MDLAARFQRLTDFLRAHQPLWRERPYVIERPTWAAEHPDLERWLLSLTMDEVAALDQEPDRIGSSAPSPLPAWAAGVAETSRIPRLELEPPPAPLPPALAWKVPRRKQDQVTAFAAAADKLLPASAEVVDWCAGKGYLGRTMAGLHGRDITYIEAREDLCQEGQQLDRRARVQGRWIAADSSSAEAHQQLAGRAAVALHACGVLHRDLVQHARQAGARSVAYSPCCYHRMTPRLGPGRHEKPPTGNLPPPPKRPRYAPISAAGASQDLDLDQHALRLPTTGEVVARPRQVELRGREQLYRLGLDLLMRQASGEDRYAPMPPFPTRWIHLSFEEFVGEVADGFGLDLARHGLDPILDRAHKRLNRARALGLVRGLFRRPLEIWLVLDTALLLQEQGYQVQILTYCAPRITPRNLLVVAT